MSTLNFYVNDDVKGKSIPVSYNSSMTIRDFLMDFLNNHSDYVSLDTKVYTFTVGSKVLNSNKFIDRKIEDIIPQGGKVLLIRKQELHYSGGGFGIDMADISNEEGLVKRNFGKAQKWNYITRGLNVTGKCENNSCEAYGKEVDCQIGLGVFDLVGDCDRVKCPMCQREIEPLTCTFCKCQYKIEGKKKIKGETTQVNTPWKKVEKDYEYYDPNKSGIVKWLKLIIETKSL